MNEIEKIMKVFNRIESTLLYLNSTHFPSKESLKEYIQRELQHLRKSMIKDFNIVRIAPYELEDWELRLLEAKSP